MAVNDFSNQNIQDTYQKVVQTDGTSLADGTGSLLPISFDGNNVTISGSLTANEYIVSSSVTNITIATLSGSTEFGDTTNDTHTFIGNITASGNISASGQIDADKIRTGGRIASSVFDIACVGSIDTDGTINSSGISNSSTYVGGGRVVLSGESSYIETPSYVSASRIITTNITASGAISASNGDIISSRALIDTRVVTPEINTDTTLTIVPDITASGNISASGDLIANNATINEGFVTVDGASTSHGFELKRDSLDTYKIRHLDGGLTIQNSTDNRKEMSFDGAGNVGIGTTDPQKKLDIAGGDIRLDNSKGIFFATTDANVGRVSIIGDESSDFIQLKVDNSNNHLLRLNTTGVGIGTSSPGEKLEVVGNISASGNIIGTINGGNF